MATSGYIYGNTISGLYGSSYNVSARDYCYYAVSDIDDNGNVILTIRNNFKGLQIPSGSIDGRTFVTRAVASSVKLTVNGTTYNGVSKTVTNTNAVTCVTKEITIPVDAVSGADIVVSGSASVSLQYKAYSDVNYTTIKTATSSWSGTIHVDGVGYIAPTLQITSLTREEATIKAVVDTTIEPTNTIDSSTITLNGPYTPTWIPTGTGEYETTITFSGVDVATAYTLNASITDSNGLSASASQELPSEAVNIYFTDDGTDLGVIIGKLIDQAGFHCYLPATFHNTVSGVNSWEQLWTGSTQGGNNITLDVSAYKKIKIWTMLYAFSITFEIDLENAPPFDISSSYAGWYSGCGVGSYYAGSRQETYYANVLVKPDKSVVRFHDTGYFYGTTRQQRNNNAGYFIYKIEGMK